MTLPFVSSRLAHPIEGIFALQRTPQVHLGELQRTLAMEQVH